jgi:hypothetical protein
MSSLIVAPGGKATISAAASDKIAIYSEGDCVLSREVGFPNYPTKESLIAFVPGQAQYVSAAVSAATTLILDNSGNPFPAFYEVGTDPVIKGAGLKLAPLQGDPVSVNTTGAVSAAAILGGIVTSTTAAAVAGTIPTGTVMDAAAEFSIGDAVDWSVINTGGANAFTVTAATDHTIVGAAAVAASTSGQFRTRKTAANTFVTYRLG